ncbi:MAG TPA: hypothetical protein VIX80_01695 [Candidatus Kapabacteria bacterium]
MKKLFFVLIACVAILTSSASIAQIKTEGKVTEVDSATGQVKTTTYTDIKKEEDITPRTNMITINPLKFFVFYNLSYYHAFNSNIAAGIGAQIPTWSDINGFGVNAEMRFYPSKKALRGFYVAPNISYNLLNDEYPSYDENGNPTTSDDVTSFSVGALVGWQWFPGDDFAIGLGIGIDYYFLSGDIVSGSTLDQLEGLKPALRFDIGYAWE